MKVSTCLHRSWRAGLGATSSGEQCSVLAQLLSLVESAGMTEKEMYSVDSAAGGGVNFWRLPKIFFDSSYSTKLKTIG
jgi:hypothetical protein